LKNILAVAIGAALLTGVAWTPTAQAASTALVQTSIQAGLAHLYGAQMSSGCPGTVASGCWNFEGYYSASTGAAVFAFLNAKGSWPAAQVANYTAAVANGFAFLIANASTNTVSTRDDGVNVCPSGAGTCTGVYWYGEGEQTYSTGIISAAVDTYCLSLGASAKPTTTGPLAGMTCAQIAQGISNDFAAAQSTPADLTSAASGGASHGYYVEYGGWRYGIPGNGDSDTSTTQWAVYAFIFDEALGATEPASTKTFLAHYLTSVQYPTGSGSNTGGVCYQSVVANGCSLGPTVSDAGGWLLANQWIGTAPSNASVQSAVSWLNANWQTNGTSSTYWFGNFSQPYAMLATYKGLETTIGTTTVGGISNLLTPTCGGNLPSGLTCNWYQDYTQSLVATQNSDGSWTGSQSWTDPLSTAFDITILSAATIPVGPLLSVPTLSALGIGALALLLALSGFMAMRTRKAHTS
jgi:hypothetical protein